MDDSYEVVAFTVGDSRTRSTRKGPGASGTTAWIVPTRTQLSAGMSPSHHHRCSPPVHVTVAVTRPPSTGARRSLTAWTSSTSGSPGRYVAAGRSAVTMTGAHAAARASNPGLAAR